MAMPTAVRPSAQRWFLNIDHHYIITIYS